MGTFETIKETDILVETAFYKWLKIRDSKGLNVDRFISTIKEYTKHVEQPFKGRTDGLYHRYAYDLFWNIRVKELI